MSRVVVLLRGINVGGHHKVPMAQLRDLAASVGLTETSTYIQSGNLVATDPADRDPESLGREFSAALAATFDFDVPVLVLPAQRVAEILRGCPWPEVEDPRFLHAVVYPAPLADELVQEAHAAVGDEGPDRVAVHGEVLWLLTPDGLSRSKTAERIMRLKLPGGGRGTARNLRSLREITARI